MSCAELGLSKSGILEFESPPTSDRDYGRYTVYGRHTVDESPALD